MKLDIYLCVVLQLLFYAIYKKNAEEGICIDIFSGYKAT